MTWPGTAVDEQALAWPGTAVDDLPTETDTESQAAETAWKRLGIGPMPQSARELVRRRSQEGSNPHSDPVPLSSTWMVQQGRNIVSDVMEMIPEPVWLAANFLGPKMTAPPRGAVRPPPKPPTAPETTPLSPAEDGALTMLADQARRAGVTPDQIDQFLIRANGRESTTPRGWQTMPPR
jgi:hypothetical protein